MKIQRLLNEAPIIQGPNRRPFTGGDFQKHGSHRADSSAISGHQRARSNRPLPTAAGPKVLMRGVGRVLDDVVGTTITSRPRKSKSSAPELGQLYNDVVLVNLPELSGHARRDDCLIATFDKATAAGFGDIATLNVTRADTPYTWIYKDFNMIDQTQRMLKIVQQVQQYMGLPDLNVAEMDQRLRQDSRLTMMFHSMTGTSGNITQYICNTFQDMLHDGRMGVADTLDEIPSHAEEIWFRGSAQITKIEHNAYA